MQIIGLLYDDLHGDFRELSPHEATNIASSIGNLEFKSSTVNKNCIELIKHFESVHDGDPKKPNLQPKMDPVGIWTVGYGRALRHANGAFMRGEKDRAAANAHKFANLTLEEAEQLLKEDLEQTYMPIVLKMVDESKFNPNQLAALCSFAYNCGSHYRNSKGAVIAYNIWANAQKMGVGATLKAYWESSVIKSNGKVFSGLIRRRKAEYHLFSTGKLKFTF